MIDSLIAKFGGRIVFDGKGFMYAEVENPQNFLEKAVSKGYTLYGTSEELFGEIESKNMINDPSQAISDALKGDTGDFGYVYLMKNEEMLESILPEIAIKVKKNDFKYNNQQLS